MRDFPWSPPALVILSLKSTDVFKLYSITGTDVVLCTEHELHKYLPLKSLHWSPQDIEKDLVFLYQQHVRREESYIYIIYIYYFRYITQVQLKISKVRGLWYSYNHHQRQMLPESAQSIYFGFIKLGSMSPQFSGCGWYWLGCIYRYGYSSLIPLTQLLAIYGHCYFDQQLVIRCNVFPLAVIFSAILERCE